MLILLDKQLSTNIKIEIDSKLKSREIFPSEKQVKVVMEYENGTIITLTMKENGISEINCNKETIINDNGVITLKD